MSAPLDAGLPPDLDLGGGYTIRFRAADPVTGATVAGVVVSQVSVLTADTTGGTSELAVGPFMLVPGPGA